LNELGDKLCDNLEVFFEDVAGDIKPSVLHGDLWSGNIAGVEGKPAIFDPATYYGGWRTCGSCATGTGYCDMVPAWAVCAGVSVLTVLKQSCLQVPEYAASIVPAGGGGTASGQAGSVLNCPVVCAALSCAHVQDTMKLSLACRGAQVGPQEAAGAVAAAVLKRPLCSIRPSSD
jgi:hypothetical protein